MMARRLDQLLCSRTPRGSSSAWSGGAATDVLSASLLDQPAAFDGRVKWWAGAGWRAKPLKRWDGAQWLRVDPKWFDRGEWVSGPAAPPDPVAPAIAFVQKSAPWESANRASLAGIAPGSCVIVFLSRYSSTITGVQGTAGGAYELLYRSGSNNTGEIWAKFDHPGGNETITTAGGDYITGGALEFAGVASTSALAATGTPRAAGEISGSSGITANAANPVAGMLELAVGGVSSATNDNGLAIASAGWTGAFTQQNSNDYTASISGFKVASGIETASFRATTTSGGYIGGVVLTLKPAA